MLFKTPQLQLPERSRRPAREEFGCFRCAVRLVRGTLVTRRVLDLHAGTGATVRALAPILAQDQAWTLYVRDVAEERWRGII